MITKLFKRKPVERILIAGAPKSGTTALYYQLKNVMPKNTKSSFEPPDLEVLQRKFRSKNFISKIVLIQRPEVDLINWFNKRILIVRDPRDILISSLLYEGGYHACWDEDENDIRSKIDLLKKKIENPGQIPVFELWDELASKTLSLEEFFRRISFVEYFADTVDCFLIHYEDFVDGRIHKLADYLEYDLNTNIEVPEVHGRVTRTKSYGDWRNWFTKEDVDFFRQQIDHYLIKLNYRLDWALNTNPCIEESKSSSYFIKLVNERRAESQLSLIN